MDTSVSRGFGFISGIDCNSVGSPNSPLGLKDGKESQF